MRRSLSFWVGPILLPAVLSAAGSQPDPSQLVRARWLMGTGLEVRLPASVGSDELVERAFEAVAELERAVSTWRADSELSLLHLAVPGPRPVSEPLASALDAAVRARAATGGAYDPAVGALVTAYGLHSGSRWPSEEERSRAAALTGTAAFAWESASRTLTLRPGTRLDFDGIAKGLALDRAAAVLRGAGATRVLLNFGGQLLAIGPPATEPPFHVEVAPAEGGAGFTVDLRDASVSTSSNSERGRLVDGRPFGHLLDPRTGDFARFRGSVTVVAPTGAEADALSTALFVEGPEAYEPGRAARVQRGVSAAWFVPEPGGGSRVLADPAFSRAGPRPEPDAHHLTKEETR